MRKLFLAVWMIVLAVVSACSPHASENLKYDLSVMSFNIRYDTEADGEHQWSKRKEACIQMFNEKKPAIIGIQEGLFHQLTFIDDSLLDYTFVGVARDDGNQSGEFNAVFYDSTRLDYMESNTFWLSETPHKASFGWDAACRRIVTWVKLKDRTSGKELFVFNTHFDHEGKEARMKSALMLLSEIDALLDNEDIVFITGDFNAQIGDSIMKPILSAFRNTQHEAPYTDSIQSFNGFGKNIPTKNIDFVFYRGVEPVFCETINTDYGVPFISDHYPVYGKYLYN